MGDELLVYDLRSQRITSLNAFAAKVWRAQSETVDALAISRSISDVEIVDVDAVEQALDLLSKANLLEAPYKPSKKTKGRSRREFVGRLFSGSALATAALAAGPAVVTILAPTPAQAASSDCGICLAPTPVCEPTLGICVECLDSEDCTDPAFPTCANNECASGGI